MDAIVEIDKAGRLVVPKKMREALHPVEGTRVALRQDGDAIVMENQTKPRGLYLKNGILVYDAGHTLPHDDVDWVEKNREERAEALMGEWTPC